MSGDGIDGGSDTVQIVSTSAPPITVGFDMSEYTFEENTTDEEVYLVATLDAAYPRAPSRVFGSEAVFAVSTESGTAKFRDDFAPFTEVISVGSDNFQQVGGQYVARTRIADFDILDDMVYEVSEQFLLKLERGGNLNTNVFRIQKPDGTAGGTYNVIITDEEDVPVLSLSVDPPSIAEEDDDTTTGTAENVSTVTVAITNAKTFVGEETVTLTFSGDATEGTHYSVNPTDADTNAAGHQVLLPAETASVPVTVTATANDSADGNRTVTVAGEFDGTAIGTRDITILDDDTTTTNDPAGGAPGIMGTPQEGHELTATLGSMADTDVLPATFPDDYDFQWVRLDSSNNPTNVGTNSSTYTVLPADVDSTIRVDVSFTDDAGNLEGPLMSTAVGPVVALLPVLSFAETRVDVDETAGTVELTVNLAPASTGIVTVNYATSNGTSGFTGAEAGEDYTAQSDTLTFTAGETSKTITIQITDDDIHEGVEFFVVDLANPSGAMESATAGRTEVHITSEDSEPTASMDDVTVDEGADTMRLTLRLSHPSSRSILYSTDSGDVGGTATVSEDYSDFLHSVNDTFINIVAGERTKDFDIAIIEDGAAEPDETITIKWTKISTDPGTPDVLNFTGTITDNDGGTATAPAIVTDGVRVTSTPAAGDTYGLGETIEITVTFDNAVTVDTSGGTPRIQFRLGPPRTDRWAAYSRGSGGTALVFIYTVQSGDMDNDGIWLEENFLQLQSGTIRAAADNTTDATLTYAEPGLQTEHKVNGSVEGFPPLAPAAPRVNGIGDNDTSLKVTWRAPDNTGRPPITHYDLRYRETGTGTSGWQDGPQDQTATNATNATIGSLTTGTPYDVQVRASNADGDGPWSPSGQGTTGVVETVETRPKGSLRLVDENGVDVTKTTGMGRLEVLYGNKKKGERKWGTVCDDRFDRPFVDYSADHPDPVNKEKVANIAATLACRWSGAGNEGAMVTADRLGMSLAPENQPIWLDDVRCAEGSTHWRGEGTEPPTALHHCYNAGVSLHNCDHSEDVYLQCTGTLEPESAAQEEAAPLTGQVEATPATHDGETPFTFRLVLSEDIANGDVDVRDSAFEVTGGSVTGASRVDGRSDLWEITVTPDGTGNIAIVLAANRACGTAGALCTADGRMLTTAWLGSVTAQPGGTSTATTSADEEGAAPLTAQFVNVPAEHDGESKFRFRLVFSDEIFEGTEPFDKNKAVRNALDITGGVAKGSRRVDKTEFDEYWIDVRPSGNGPVTISLSPASSCSTSSVTCTPDGRKLSAAISARVEGPPGLSVADAEVQEGPGAALAFAVTLDRSTSAAVQVDYATRDGTAQAGSDYTASSGTLSFAPGETAKTVTVAVLDDSHDEGSETLTLVLSNPSGAYLADGEATGTIENTDHMPQAWIARFGRTVADQVLDAVDARLRASRTAGMSVSLAGQRIGLAAPQAAQKSGAESGAESGSDPNPASLFGGTAAEDAGETARLKTLSDWLKQETAENDRPDGWSRTLTGREVLMGSSFSLAAQTEGGGFAGLWGRMAQTRFAGREGALSLDGDVTTGLVGADYASGRWTTGLVVSHSIGEGGYRGESSGEIEASVTALTPWAGYAVTERLSVWGAAGYGVGELKLTAGDDPALKTDLGMTLAAAGARGTLIDGDGPKLDAVTDARWVRTTTARVSSASEDGGNLASASAEVTRLRLGLEGSWPLALGDEVFGKGATVTPRLAIGVRHDGGDAETGFGADIGGGVALAAPAHGLTLSLEGRGVLTHEAAGLRDRGVAGTLAWNPPPAGRGPQLTLTQTIGAGASGGTDALLSRTTLEGLAANDNGGGRRRLEARFGYGFSAFGDRFTWTPEIGLGLSEAGRDYSLGWRLRRDGSGPGSLELSLEAQRRESANDNTPPEHGIGLAVTARW